MAAIRPAPTPLASLRRLRWFPPLRLGLVGALMLVPGTLAAQSTGQAPVEIQETDTFGLGARALGMGNAQVAVADDPAAIFYNPAGLAQLTRAEIVTGLSHDTMDRTTSHFGTVGADRNHTRFTHLIGAFPAGYRGQPTMTFALGYHRWADLDDVAAREGLLVAPAPDGLYEIESYRRNGTLDAWSAAVGVDLGPNLSVGGAIRLLTGSSTESIYTANFRARQSGSDLVLDLGTPSDPDVRVFEQQIYREADALGVTGSMGLLARFESGIQLGATVDLPATLDWEGESWFQLEDTEKIDGSLIGYPTGFFEDDLTLPLALSGGLSYQNEMLLLAGGMRWTDYTQIDYEGEILAPSDGSSLLLEPAYRSVVAWNVGAELQFPNSPLRVRGGFFTEPVPYDLITADTDFTFVADDGDPNTTSDASQVARDYPRAEILSDREYFTVGAGLELEEGFTLDAGFAWGTWERQTTPRYENTTDFYETRATVEEVEETRLLFSAGVRFR